VRLATVRFFSVQTSTELIVRGLANISDKTRAKELFDYCSVLFFKFIERLKKNGMCCLIQEESIIFVRYNVHQFLRDMKVISSAELRSNMKKYLDLANTETIVIQRGKTETFYLQAEKYLVPDVDLARAITMDELLAGVKEDMRKMFKKAENESFITS
jgi:hypothetical protein